MVVFFDNTGIFPLLLRGTKKIICFDASNDKAEEHIEYKKLIEISSLLGIEITAQLPSLDSIPRETYSSTKGRYKDGSEFEIIHMPHWNFCEKNENSDFPHHPTHNQSYDLDLFNQYVRLGEDAASHYLNQQKDYTASVA